MTGPALDRWLLLGEKKDDLLAVLIGRDIAGVAARAPGGVPLVLDLFAGSANTLYWISRHVHARRAVGFERDDTVFALTDANLPLVGAGIELIHESYDSGLPALGLPDGGLPGGEPVVLFVAPPWGRALGAESGLDLRCTAPPVAQILRFCARTLGSRPMLVAVQVADQIQQDSLAEVTALLDWSALTMYDINAPGHKAGVLLGTTGWSPR